MVVFEYNHKMATLRATPIKEKIYIYQDLLCAFVVVRIYLMLYTGRLCRDSLHYNRKDFDM